MAMVLAWACWLVWAFGFQTVWARYITEVSGTVIEARDVPSSTTPRYATEYVVRGSDGRDRSYVAGATDASLDRSLPVGTRINKVRGQLDYERDGVIIKFPSGFYALVSVGVLALVLWVGSRALAHWPRRQGHQP